MQINGWGFSCSNSALNTNFYKSHKGFPVSTYLKDEISPRLNYNRQGEIFA